MQEFPKVSDQCVYMWYTEQQSVGVFIKGVELKAVAKRFALRFGYTNFKPNIGWLSQEIVL